MANGYPDLDPNSYAAYDQGRGAPPTMPYGQSLATAAGAVVGLPTRLVGRALGVPAYGATPAPAMPSPTVDADRETARFAGQQTAGQQRAATQQAITSAGYQESLRDADQNYDRYKRAQAAAKTQLNQPYPGGVDMTNAAHPGGGGGDQYSDAINAQQQKLNFLRSGGGGWLGLFQSGGAQRQLNFLRQQQIEQGRLGVEQGRLNFDTGRYWQGENPLEQARLGLEGQKFQFLQMQHEPEMQFQNRLQQLYQKGDPASLALAQRLQLIRTGKNPFIVSQTPLVTRTIPIEQAEQGGIWNMMPTDPTSGKPMLFPPGYGSSIVNSQPTQ